MAKYYTKIARSASTGRWTTADAQRFEKQAVEFTKTVTASPEAARKYLVELGTHTSSGKLTRKYGG